MAYETLPAELDNLLTTDATPPQTQTTGDSRPGKLPKAKLNKKLITAIVRRLKILYLDAAKKEDRLLINEIIEDLEELMLLNNIATDLIEEKET